jgi:acetyl-CoA acetyltransferase
MFPKARIPYGTWGSSYFPAWQTSALAEVNIGQFAGEAMNRILGKRQVSSAHLECLVIGSTVPWHWKFWNAPLVASCLGRRVPGFHVEAACATGLLATVAAGAEVESGAAEVVGVLTFDRTSDSPVGVFPERRTYQRTVPLADVWDNFGFDPATSGAMIATAGKAARKYKLDRREVDEVALVRHEQYFAAKASGALDNVVVPLEILNAQGRPLGTIDDDRGVRRLSAGELRTMRALDTCVTGGTQTHASDGMASLLVATEEKAKELSPRPEVKIEFIAKAEVRALDGLMPEAPGLAVRKLLGRTGLKMADIPVVVNDVVFAKMLDYDWRKMNRTGCSLVWGHPQGPTLTRTLIEGLEEAVSLGGGYVLIFGCAAGDIGTSALFKVS